jgi:hypothetical protein
MTIHRFRASAQGRGVDTRGRPISVKRLQWRRAPRSCDPRREHVATIVLRQSGRTFAQILPFLQELAIQIPGSVFLNDGHRIDGHPFSTRLSLSFKFFKRRYLNSAIPSQRPVTLAIHHKSGQICCDKNVMVLCSERTNCPQNPSERSFLVSG